MRVRQATIQGLLAESNFKGPRTTSKYFTPVKFELSIEVFEVLDEPIIRDEVLKARPNNCNIIQLLNSTFLDDVSRC